MTARGVSAGSGGGSSQTSRSTVAALEAAIAAHDEAAAAGVPIWLGAEPTFTDRYSESPEWLCEALGADKEARARKLVLRLLEHQAGAVVLRPIGRPYAGEATPRWCYGLYARRSGAPLWGGPMDTFEDGQPTPETVALVAKLRKALVGRLSRAGWFAAGVATPEASPLRLVCRRDGQGVTLDPAVDVRLGRESIHAVTHDAAPVDQLASDAVFLILLHAGAGGPGANDAWVELPALPDVASFALLLELCGSAARDVGVRGLGLRGFPPPVDESVAWTTLTPDPAVLEVNQAPEASLAAFYRSTRVLFELAAAEGLSPFRLHYNGAVSDSGGGGQLTFGGPSPAESPFIQAPQLLPRLIRYLIRHPSLSYWFATQYVGGSSQSPRPDEGVRESFLELDVALEQLALLQAPSLEIIWGTLRHFLADASGNPHRSELNIEKLHNRFLPGRGCLGLVELRALSMPRSCEVASTRALLLRSLLVMLCREDKVRELMHWGDELHDRFALPFFLRQDLREVFADLRCAGLALGRELEQLLLEKEALVLGTVDCGGFRLNVQQALEFWPLVGDVASQEGGGSRLVDASTSRLQVRVDPLDERGDLGSLRLMVKGYLLPLRSASVDVGAARVIGLRFRSFVPWSGLHPAIGAEKAVQLMLGRPDGDAVRVTLFPWRPDGEAYPGLPGDLAEASARRNERFVVERITGHAARAALEAAPLAPAAAVTPYCVDLRRLPVLPGA